MWTSTHPKLASSNFKIGGSGVVHVERHRFAVRHHQPGVPDRAVGGRAQGDDHQVEVTLGAADAVLHRIGRLEEAVKPQGLQRAPQVGHREVGQQDDGVLVDVGGEVGRVEVIGVEVADVEVVAVAERVPVQGAVVGKRKPGCEIGGIHPRIAENAANLPCRSGSLRVRHS